MIEASYSAQEQKTTVMPLVLAKEAGKDRGDSIFVKKIEMSFEIVQGEGVV